MIRVLLLFVIINVALLAVSGVRTGGDTGIYVDGARGLLDGQPLSQRQPSYLGYIAVVAFFESIGMGLMGVVLFQLALATAAAAAVFKIGAALGGPLAGAIAALLLAMDLDTNRWHVFILADSLYLSALTVSVWLVYRAAKPSRLRQGYGGQASPPAFAKASAGKQALKPYIAASVVLLLSGLIRPEGWFVIPAAAIYWVVRGVSAPSRRWASLGVIGLACVLMMLVLAPRLSGNVEAVDPAEMLRRGQTIWDYDGWRVSMPREPSFDSEAGSASVAVNYAVKHPIGTLKLMAARVGVHIAHVRPFYSLGHNAAILVWLLPVYILGGYGAWVLRRNVLARWCAAVIGTQALVVALTHADWDGRYLAHVLPIFYPLAACGIALLMKRWAPRLTARIAVGH